MIENTLCYRSSVVTYQLKEI